MEDSQQAPVEPSTVASGEKTETPAPESKKDVVAYDTYRKVLSEKKKRDEQLGELASRVEEFERREKEREEGELRQKEDFKKLLELRENELGEYRSKYEQLTEQTTNATKLTSILDNLPGKVSQKYWDKLPLDDVVIDQDSGRPDEVSVKKAIEKFVSEYPEIVQRQASSKVQPAAPKPVTEALGDSRQEMLERLAKSNLFSN